MWVPTAAAALLALAGCGGSGDDGGASAPDASSPMDAEPTSDGTTTPTTPVTPTTAVPAPTPMPAGGPEALVVEVVGERPHDAGSFVQGLVLDGDRVYESAGLYGESDVRVVDAHTGAVLDERAVDAAFFAEGLALVDGQLVQLTWKEGVAFVYDAQTLEPTGEHRYEGEGWGLCYDGTRLVMSDGSPRLTFRSPDTFAATGATTVTLDGVPVEELNELECVGGDVWANVWQTDEILRIDPRTGQVTGVVDAAGLLDQQEAAEADVLNGIAYDPTSDTFLVTGKLWPTLFEVRFVPAA